jgi:glycyl-tRNA synthetase beta chain
MYAKLLVEVGVEELPAIPLLKIIDNIKSSWSNILDKYMLSSDFEFYYTPRRLVLIHDAMPLKQADSDIELFGPPTAIAIKDGTPTPAGTSFANKCGVDFSKLSTTLDRSKEVLYYKSKKEGVDTVLLLEDMIKEWVSSMAFGKMMRWGERSDEFIRPIRWLQVRLDDKNIDVELFGVKSDTFTYVHRMKSFEPVSVDSMDNYEDILANGNVVLKPTKRKESILADFEIIQKEHDITIEIDEDLLDEVVAITENPKALFGSFDKSFLELPPEVIITSMKENQRYFPVFQGDKLSNHFIVVSNALTDDYSKVIEGNERVLKPRLSDAMFFYKNDLKRGLKTDGLELVQFMDGLGTVANKIDREESVALRLLAINRVSNNFQYLDDLNVEDSLSLAIRLAKADLTSEIVYEFTDLQGIIGSYYFNILYPNNDSRIVEAIKEQYEFNGLEISNQFSAIVNIAIKLDTLIGMFSIGQIPTGSRDPFALRRAVNGIIDIAIKHKVSLNFSTFIRDKAIQKLYPSVQDDYTHLLEKFIVERLRGTYPDVNPSIIQAVVNNNQKLLLDIEVFDIKIRKVHEMTIAEDAKESFSLIKRLANILKDETVDYALDTEEFTNIYEENLYNKYAEIITGPITGPTLERLFEIKKSLDDFFDNVMVNDDDPKIRNNRKRLLNVIYREFEKFADFKEITI